MAYLNLCCSVDLGVHCSHLHFKILWFHSWILAISVVPNEPRRSTWCHRCVISSRTESRSGAGSRCHGTCSCLMIMPVVSMDVSQGKRRWVKMMFCWLNIPCIHIYKIQGKNRYRFAGASFRHEFIFQALTNLEHILKRSSSRWTVSRLDKSLRMSCVGAFGCWELPPRGMINLRLFEAQMQEEKWLKAIKGLSQRQEWLHNLIPNLYLQQLLNLRHVSTSNSGHIQNDDNLIAAPDWWGFFPCKPQTLEQQTWPDLQLLRRSWMNNSL